MQMSPPPVELVEVLVEVEVVEVLVLVEVDPLLETAVLAPPLPTVPVLPDPPVPPVISETLVPHAANPSTVEPASMKPKKPKLTRIPFASSESSLDRSPRARRRASLFRAKRLPSPGCDDPHFPAG
jgi:hypothetical protein